MYPLEMTDATRWHRESRESTFNAAIAKATRFCDT